MFTLDCNILIKERNVNNMSKNEEYGVKAHQYIPAGAHTYSRTDEVFPENAPRIFKKGKGPYAWDVDGNKYLDYAMACRSVTVGYNYDRISNAAIEQIYNGNTMSKASQIEVDAAELLCNMIPWVDMVKFAKNGSTVTTAAIKLARAYTGKKYIVRCRQHSFFSYDDWFIGDTVMSAGVPNAISELTLDFDYNNIQSIKNVFEEHKGEIAALIMEPAESEEPVDDFLNKTKKLCEEYKVIYILDEMITGFRWDMLGACKYYNVEPDLVTYGKGMANGFSVAALGGKKEIMQLGGLEAGKERVFLISTTHGAEMSSLGAFVENMNVYQEMNVIEQIWKSGKQIVKGLNSIAKEYGIENYFGITGAACSPNYFAKNKQGNDSFEFRTLFAQEMLKEGIIMPYISICYEHKENEIQSTLEAARKALKVYSLALEDGVEKYLEGRPIKPVFRKYN